MALIFIVAGLVLGYGAHYFLRKRPALGETLFLSADAAELQALKAGKLVNLRAASELKIADAAHGETGLVVIVVEKF